MALTVDSVRTYVKDNEDMNILLEGGLQSSDDLIALAMSLAVSDFNSTPPVMTYTVENFPNDVILLYGTLHHLANSEAERQLRNNVNFNAQGLQAGIDDKQPSYTSLAGYYKQLFDSRVQSYKNFVNTEAAWGGAPSPYIGINSWDFRD